LLDNLRKEMKNKYNLTNSTEFSIFVETASKATQLMNKLDWTFINGCSFAYAAITTVGEKLTILKHVKKDLLILLYNMASL
jgi:hypothetical protein